MRNIVFGSDQTLHWLIQDLVCCLWNRLLSLMEQRILELHKQILQDTVMVSNNNNMVTNVFKWLSLSAMGKVVETPKESS